MFIGRANNVTEWPLFGAVEFTAWLYRTEFLEANEANHDG